jgi:hypothetical protein
VPPEVSVAIAVALDRGGNQIDIARAFRCGGALVARIAKERRSRATLAALERDER